MVFLGKYLPKDFEKLENSAVYTRIGQNKSYVQMSITIMNEWLTG
jgi:hypothetical protein